MGIKKIGVDTNYATYEELKQRHVVAQGWSEFGDLTFLLDPSEDIEEYLPRITYGSQGGKNTFNQLFRKIKSGDIILALEGNQIKGIAEIPDKFTYCYDSEFDYSNSLFPVTWVDWNSFCKDVNFMSQGGQGAPGIVDCWLDNINGYINRNWGKFKRENNIDIQPKQCEAQLEALIKNLDERIKETKINYMKALNNEENSKKVEALVNVLISNHNLILTGAPGTGKTYLAKQIAQQMIFGEIKDDMNPNEEKQFDEQCDFVQFHPSYDYTDFVEGLRPKEDNGNVVFKLQNGIFKAFCKKSLTPKLIKPVEDITIRIANYGLIYQHMLDSLKVGDKFKEKSGNVISISKIDIENQTLTLSNSNNNEVVFTKDKLQKHIELYPTGKSLHNDHNNENITGNASVFWAVANYFYEYYYIHTLPFIFIIDEINRGEISKIFGELFYSIDPGYRGKKGKVRTQYANMQTKPNDFDEALGINDPDNCGHFFVPENVYILGTMNDIDRSVESMDFAFRRRFAFKEITAEDSKQMLDSDDAWGKDKMPKPDFLQKVKDKMDAINKVIFDDDEKIGIEGLSSAYHIGASYFLKLANYRNENGEYDETSFSDLWENHLEGLLLEYMRGMADVQKKIKKLANAYGYSKMNKYE